MKLISDIIIGLTKGFIKKMNRAPNKLEEMKIKQKALEKFRESRKVIDMKTGAPMDEQGIASLVKQPKKPATGFKSLSDEATKRGEARHILKKDEFKDILTPKQLDELNNPDSRKDVLKLYEEVFSKKALDVLPGTGNKVDSDNLFDLLMNTTDKKGLDAFDSAFDPSSALDIIKKGITRNKKQVENIVDMTGRATNFATKELFEKDLDRIMGNVIKNSPGFNLEIVNRFKKAGGKLNKTYKDDPDFMYTPEQRQTVLSKIEGVMKDDEYQRAFQNQFADLMEEGDEAISFAEDLFRIDKAAGGRVGFAKGSKGIASKINDSTIMQMLYDPRIIGTEIGVEGALETLRLFGLYSEGGRVGLAEGTPKTEKILAAEKMAKEKGITVEEALQIIFEEANTEGVIMTRIKEADGGLSKLLNL